MNSDDMYINFLAHYGIEGQKWGVRRFQNEDGTWTEEGKKRYGHLYGEEGRLQKSTYKESKNAMKIAKEDYKSGKITKDEYKEITTRLNASRSGKYYAQRVSGLNMSEEKLHGYMTKLDAKAEYLKKRYEENPSYFNKKRSERADKKLDNLVGKKELRDFIQGLNDSQVFNMPISELNASLKESTKKAFLKEMANIGICVGLSIPLMMTTGYAVTPVPGHQMARAGEDEVYSRIGDDIEIYKANQRKKKRGD